MRKYPQVYEATLETNISKKNLKFLLYDLKKKGKFTENYQFLTYFQALYLFVNKRYYYCYFFVSTFSVCYNLKKSV